MLVLGLDLETSGIDPLADQIIEIGAILWDTKRKTPMQFMSRLIEQKDLKLDEKITKITGIESEDLNKFGIDFELALKELQLMATSADYIVAHNGNQFDRLFLEEVWKNYPDTRINKKWIDTTTDLPFEEEITTRKLGFLAAEHGFLNPFAHRAVFDVMTMMKVFSKYPINKIIELSESETKRLIAKVSYDDRDLAKKEGFRWDPNNKFWYKDVKEVAIGDLSYPFSVDYV